MNNRYSVFIMIQFEENHNTTKKFCQFIPVDFETRVGK